MLQSVASNGVNRIDRPGGLVILLYAAHRFITIRSLSGRLTISSAVATARCTSLVSWRPANVFAL